MRTVQSRTVTLFGPAVSSVVASAGKRRSLATSSMAKPELRFSDTFSSSGAALTQPCARFTRRVDSPHAA